MRFALSIFIIFVSAWLAFAQPSNNSSLRAFVESQLEPRNSEKHRERPRRTGAFEDICDVDGDSIAARVFREYGAVFAAGDSVKRPPQCIFRSEDELSEFQGSLKTKKSKINGFEIELQEKAMEALLDAVKAAEERGLPITPLDGSIAGRRSLADTLRIWNSRFIPALDYWVARNRITREQANEAIKLPVREQVTRVVEWESRGIYFSTDKRRSIFSSVAPPGTSQHLSMLAFDIEQDGVRDVRSVLNRYGWYQTVLNDPPHFTFLGLQESELPTRGLRRVTRGGHTYWVPIVSDRLRPIIAPSN